VARVERLAEPAATQAPDHDATRVGGAPATPIAAGPKNQNVAVSVSDAAASRVLLAAGAARETAAQADVSSQIEDAVAGKRLSLKLSLRQDRRLAAASGGARVPELARQRTIGSVAKPIMLASVLVMLVLLLAGGYWMLSRDRTAAGLLAGLRSDLAMLERTATPPSPGQAGHELPAAPGEVSQPRPPEPAPAQVESTVSLPTVPPAPPSPLVAVAPARPASAPAPAAVPSVAPAPPKTIGAGGKASAQLSTVFSRKVVTYEWHRLQKLLPDLLGSRELVVSKHHRGGRTRWMLRTGGFATGAQAAEFCQLVHAKGFHCQVIKAEQNDTLSALRIVPGRCPGSRRWYKRAARSLTAASDPPRMIQRIWGDCALPVAKLDEELRAAGAA
jgi:hypothetical protein